MKATELKVGDILLIQEDDAKAQYVIVGFNTYKPNTIDLDRKDIYCEITFGENSLYENSILDNFMKNFEHRFTQAHRNLMVDADIICAVRENDSITLNRRVFARSLTEVGLGNNHNVAEGKSLPFYGSKDSRRREMFGYWEWYWLRSWYSSSNARFVDTDGTANYDYPSDTYGVVPAHVLKSDIRVMPTDNGYEIIY